MPVGHTPDSATVAFPVVPNVAGTPFTLSFAATFGIAVPPVAGAVPASVTGPETAVTVISSETVGSEVRGVW